MSSSQNSSSSSDASAFALALAPLHDVVCTVDVVLGETQMSVGDCLRLEPETTIRLTNSAGGDLTVLVNGIPVAHGEVVIVDDSTAIRVTELLSPPSSEILE
jgi:flagellar motor switch protein FliN/FliY